MDAEKNSNARGGEVPEAASIVEEARLYPETTGKRLGQIVRFELQNPDTPTTPLDAAAHGPLGHLSPPPDDDSNRGSNSELRQAARDALQALLQGNARFRKGVFERCKPDMELLEELTEEQAPSVVVLACSDSRCPPEMVFDQGLGDLYCLRVSGNTVNDYVMGSIVHAVQQLGVRCVVILGHTRCGMVARAVHSWARHEAKKSASERARQAAPDVPVPSAPAARTSEPARMSTHAEENGTPARPQQGSSGGGGGGGLFRRLCACGSSQPEQEQEQHVKPGPPEGQPLERDAPQAGQPLQSPFQRASGSIHSSPSDQGRMRSGSVGRSSLGVVRERGSLAGVNRTALDRISTNPLGVILHSLQGAVDHVAQREGRLAHIVSKIGRHDELEDLGGTGLRTQDSLGITRARLAKQKRNESAALFDQIHAMEGVEEVATQNTVLNAKAVLKGLAKCCSGSLIEEVEVVAAKFDLESGEVRVIKKGWYSGTARSFFYE